MKSLVTFLLAFQTLLLCLSYPDMLQYSLSQYLGSWEEAGAQLAFRLVGDDRVRNRLQTVKRGQGGTEKSWE